MGLSMGGHALCEYIRHYPEHPGGLIFCNTEARFDLSEVFIELKQRAGDEVAEIARLQLSQPTAEITQEYLRKVVPYYAKNAYTSAEVARCEKNIALFNHYCSHEMNNFNYLEDMENVQCPTLIMAGDDSPLHRLSFATEMAERIPQSLVQLEIFSGCGAPVYKDDPEKSFTVVSNFLQNKI
jgi:proline iminopeptidase